MVAIKLIQNIDKSSYTTRKVLREIIILRKLSEMDENLFTIKLLDVIIPLVEEKDSSQIEKKETSEDVEKQPKETF